MLGITGRQIFSVNIILNNFLPICFNICFGCSKELSHRDGSFEYPQHMFWLRNMKVSFSLTDYYLDDKLEITEKVCRDTGRQKVSEYIISNIFLNISFNMCFGCSKELSHCDSSFEYPHYVLVENFRN